jgi:hypothetical protein
MLRQRISNAFTGCRAAAGTAALAKAYCVPIRTRSPRGSSLDPHDSWPAKAMAAINRGGSPRKCAKVRCKDQSAPNAPIPAKNTYTSTQARKIEESTA